MIERKVTFNSETAAPSPRYLAAGMQGDNNSRLIRFDVPTLTDDQIVMVKVSVGTITDEVQLYKDDEGLYDWTISSAVLQEFGDGGKIQVEVSDPNDPLDMIWQSGVIQMSIGASVDVDTSIVQRETTLLGQIKTEMQRVEKATAASETAAAASATEAAASATSAANTISNAQQYVDDAAAQVELAKVEVTNAANQVILAKAEVSNAAAQVDLAKAEVTKAAAQATAAASSANDAAASVTDAEAQVELAKDEVDKAAEQASAAASSAALAKDYADQASSAAMGELDNVYLKITDYTAADVLSKVKTLDGEGSGLDADTLDGNEASAFASASHMHAQSEISGLESTLSGKAAASHSHEISEITSLQTSLDAKAASSHTHTISEISSLQSTLDNKAAKSHAQAASTITGGTLAGKVIANSSAVATLTSKQVRNVIIATTEPSSAVNGDIWLSYS